MIRAAVTQTRNAFRGMPASVAELDGLADQLEAIRAANVKHHLELIARAATWGVQAIGLGEMFTGPYFALDQRLMWKGLAEDAHDGPTVRALQAAAAEHQMVIVAPIYERVGARYFNTAVVIDADGRRLGSYRKTHIPHGANEQGAFHEGLFFEVSDGGMVQTEANCSSHAHFPVFETRVGRIGVAICYDRHFEGVMRTLAEAGAQLIFNPAVTFGADSERMWPIEAAVDARRHGVYIGLSNRLGAEPPWTQVYYGRSHFCGPAGPLPDLCPDGALIISDLDLSQQGDTAGWSLDEDRRPDIYAR